MSQDDRFWVTLQRADGLSDVTADVTVRYVVVEEGVYPNMEAVRFESSVTDGSGSWVGEQRSYQNTYGSPVVIGQVMSTSDEAFSVFWARGADATSPPSSQALFVGKHVGEDPNTVRSTETIGYIVIEEGKRTLGGLEYLAGVGGDTVVGMDEGPVIPLYQMNRTSLQVHFNELIDPDSVGTDDLTLSSGAVTRAEVVDGDTARYTLVGVAPGLSIEMQAGALMDQLGNPILPFTATYSPETTKFYVVDGDGCGTFEYGAAGSSLASQAWPLPCGDGFKPMYKGATANAAGTTVWVVDSDWTVYVFDMDGGLQGSWVAGTGLPRAEGIATDGTDVWIMDFKKDKVLRYSDAASRLSGSQAPSSTFPLLADDPTGITTDGSTLWIVDHITDRVYLYSTDGVLQGDWKLHSANTSPSGLTIDPSGASDSVWVVDAGTDAVYEYDRDTGEFRGNFPLDVAAGNGHPTGIADPPTSRVRETVHQPLATLVSPETDRATSLLRPEILMVSVELPRLLSEVWSSTKPHDAVVDLVMPSDLAGDTDWVDDRWLLPLMIHAEAVQRPDAVLEAGEVRIIHDIADEGTELLDEDLLALIAAGRE